MVDISIIKAHYSSLPDEQLISLAEQEGPGLTDDALHVLRDEFLKRKLDMSPFESMEADKTAQRKLNIQKIQESAAGEYEASVWEHIFEAKSNAKTDDDILKDLLEMGVSEEHALLLIKNIEVRATKMLHHHDVDMVIGGMICIAGIAITAATYLSAINGGAYVVTWGAILFGAIRFFRGFSNGDKYKAVLNAIAVEKQTADT